jgi:large subunit ribosomal protein L10
MARPEKVAVVEEVRDKLREADAAVLTEYRGLSVTALAELRGALRPASTEYKVFKNTLARRAAESAGLTDLVPYLEGPVAIAFVHGDAVVAAKALRDFGRTNPALIIKAGLLGEQVLAPTDVESLADIEPRDVLLARLANGFQAPLAKAANLFQAFNRNFAYGLKAYIDQRVAGGETLALTADEHEPDPSPAEPASNGSAPPADATDEPDTPAAPAAQTDTEAASATEPEPPAQPTGDAAPEET